MKYYLKYYGFFWNKKISRLKKLHLLKEMNIEEQMMMKQL